MASAETLVRVETENWIFLRVIDGDTIQVRAPFRPLSLSIVSIRLRGADTPERGAKAHCDWEQAQAEAATQFTENFLLRGQIELRHLAWDKYGGRIDADILVNGRSLAKALIMAELARYYDGSKRPGWCP